MRSSSLPPALLFWAVASTLAAQPVDISKGLTLQNRFVRLEFEPGTMGLAAMVDREHNQNHIRATKEKQLLWEVAFAKGAIIERVTNLTKPCTHAWVETLAEGGQRAIFEWNDQRFWTEKRALTVHATVELPGDSGIATWRIYVENRSDYWGLWTVSYPLVNGFPEKGQYDLARPIFAGGGRLYKRWTDSSQDRYPSGGFPMQFVSLQRGESTVYFGTRDSEARAKDFVLDASAEGRAGIVHYVENMGVAGSSYPDYYPVEFGIHSGNWVASALHYREWALRQKWAAAGPLSHRSQMPDKIKNVGLWMRDDWLWQKADGTPHQQNTPFLEAAERLGVPLALHWYNWHHMPFDTEYPHYFPTKPGFRERVKELTSQGLLVMPYINGSSADMNNPDWAKFAPHAIVDESGGFRMHLYSGEPGRLLSMCPSSNVWRQTIADVVDKLVREEGVNGAYVDQVSAMEHELCFNRDHHHPLGGGHYWADGYRDELRMIRNSAQREQREAIITSESSDEIFLDLVDANLTWSDPTNNEIPLLQVVYSGYTLLFGSLASYKGSERLFNFAQGQAFIDGRQNGWMELDILSPEHKAMAEQLKQCGRYRVAARDFVTYGRLWGPVEPLRPIPTFREPGLKIPENRPETVSAEARLWQAEDGRLAILFANYSDEAVNFAWKLKPADYGVRSARLQLADLTPDGSKALGAARATIERTETLAPRALKIIVIQGQ